jgi:hypothetical protein
MGKLLDGFISQYDDEDSTISLKELMDAEELVQWELMVKVFNELEIANMGPNLRKIAKFYKLERWQEMSVLALVKVMEMMLANAKDRMDEVNDRMEQLDKLNMDINDSDRMFG